MLIGGTEVCSHWFGHQEQGGQSGRSGRDQYRLEGLEIPEGNQEATHQYCPRNGFSQKRSERFPGMLFSFLPEDARCAGPKKLLIDLNYQLVPSIELVDASLTFASISVTEQELVITSSP